MAKHSTKIKKARADLIFDCVNYFLLSLVLVAVIYPLWFVLIASFSDPSYVSTGKVLFWVKGFTLEGYQKALSYTDIWTGFRNSIFYTLAGATISTAFTCGVGYMLSRRDLVGRGFFTAFFMICMFFTGGLIPTYMVVRDVGLTNTIWALLVPNSVWVYNLFICRTFFKTTIPDELLEASQIDGCNNLRFFFSIVVPLSTATIAVQFLFYGVAQWNDYFQAMIYLRKTELYPLQIHLRNILIANTVDSSMTDDAETVDAKQRIADMLKYVLIIVSTVPMLVLYPFLQKYFVKGVMIGAVKG